MILKQWNLTRFDLAAAALAPVRPLDRPAGGNRPLESGGGRFGTIASATGSIVTLAPRGRRICAAI